MRIELVFFAESKPDVKIRISIFHKIPTSSTTRIFFDLLALFKLFLQMFDGFRNLFLQTLDNFFDLSYHKQALNIAG